MMEQHVAKEAMLKIMNRSSEQRKKAADNMAAACQRRTRAMLRPSVDLFRAFSATCGSSISMKPSVPTTPQTSDSQLGNDMIFVV
jgi:hypothetical protein